MERKQFTFYRSFYETISKLPDKEQLSVYRAVCEYALDGTEPDLSGTADIAFSGMKWSLEWSRMKAERGKKGGSNRTSVASEQQSVASTSIASEQLESNNNVNVNVNDNSNVNVNSNGNGSEAATPTTEQVRDFFRKMNLKGDPDRFWMFNESKGWTVDNWQLAAMGWSGKEGHYEQETGRDAPIGNLMMKAVNKRKEANKE